MLGPTAGSYKTWADEAKSDIHEALKKEIDSALGLDHYKDFKPSVLSRPLQDGIRSSRKFLNLLPSLPKG